MKSLSEKRLALLHGMSSDKNMASITCIGSAINYGISRRSTGMERSWGAVAIFGGFRERDVFKDGLLKGINNEKIEYARGMLLGKKVARDDIPCTTCSIYLGMRAAGKWLARKNSAPFRTRFISRLVRFSRLQSV
jgi:hypothetical protein